MSVTKVSCLKFDSIQIYNVGLPGFVQTMVIHIGSRSHKSIFLLRRKYCVLINVFNDLKRLNNLISREFKEDLMRSCAMH